METCKAPDTQVVTLSRPRRAAARLSVTGVLLALACMMALVVAYPVSPAQGDLRFVDATEEAGLIHSSLGHGAAAADYDGDGDTDLFLAMMAGKDKLFRNDGGGHFTEIAEEAGVAGEETTLDTSALFFDYDADGDLDLLVLVMGKGANKLFRNEGNDHFTDVSEASGLSGLEADLKLSRCAAVLVQGASGALGLVLTTQAGPTRLLQNIDGRFELATNGKGPVNLTPQPDFAGLGVAVADLNGDSDRDIVIANYGGSAVLLPAFEFTRPSPAVGVALGDYDNDGDLDLCITGDNTPQRLYRNDGGAHFTDVTEESGIEAAGFGRDVGFADFDNDGDLDLYIASDGPDYLYENIGGRFTEVEPETGYWNAGNTANCLIADLDSDGDLDIYANNYTGSSELPKFADMPSSFYRNETEGGHFLKVQLRLSGLNRFGVGAKLWVYKAGHLGDPKQLLGYREIVVGQGYGSSGPPEAHFGLGARTLADLEVALPAVEGRLEYWGIAADQMLVVSREGWERREHVTPP